MTESIIETMARAIRLAIDIDMNADPVAVEVLQALIEGGWVVVPREPTDAMMVAGDSLSVPSEGYHPGSGPTWIAMVSTFLEGDHGLETRIVDAAWMRENVNMTPEFEKDLGSSGAESAASVASDQTGQYRKRPVVIEAYEFQNKVGMDTRPAWILDAVEAGTIKFHNVRNGPPYLMIKTLEGDMLAQTGDWIIKGVKGEIYPCKPDIFAMTYEPTNPQGEA